jgi:hypothetical protein
MNDDDVLARAVRALRDGADGSSAAASTTRLQILTRALNDRRRRHRVLFVVMPLAAAFFASVAWGAATGRLSRWVEMMTGRPAPQQTTEPMAHAGAAGSPLAPDPSPSVPTASSPTTEATPRAPAGSATSSPSAVSAMSAPTRPTNASPSPTPSAFADEQSLYAGAHAAHFVDRNPAAALRGWNAYLAAYPNGRFALEARYNRAICLVRLGRSDQAREALGPFARGDHGNYRQREARDLLDALAADGGPLNH